MKKKFLILVIALVTGFSAFADEGMWLLPYLEKMNIKDMKAKGLKLSAKDIYNMNGSSLKDAIIIFGAGCTGEIVSSEGLIFTNHHCGYGAIQKLSSVQHDYLKDGFWAMNRVEELPAEGLSVKFIRHIQDVTPLVLTKDFNTEQEREQTIKDNIIALTKAYSEQNPGKEILIRDMFAGNQYLLFVIEVFNDIRLVGTPPSSIGKFGGETDNWMWPRHTGDFSIFRVYADKDGNATKAYSKENVPYKTPTHLKVSLKGYNEGDFAMIMGFPGRTTRYMTSYEIDNLLNVENPTRINIRGVRQEVLKKDMEASDDIRIKYASKYAQSSNYWKNSIGKSRGLVKLNVKGDKESIEHSYMDWALAPGREKHQKSLEEIKVAVEGSSKANLVNQYLMEIFRASTEMIYFSSISNAFAAKDTPTQFVTTISDDLKNKVLPNATAFYKNYNEPTERKVAKEVIKIAYDSLKNEDRPKFFDEVIRKEFNGDINAYVDFVYDNSVFATEEKFNNFIQNYDPEVLTKDPARIAIASVIEKANEMIKIGQPFAAKYTIAKRDFVAGLMEMNQDKMFYPDANSTIRLTYGNILSYQPVDAVKYDYYTTLSGVIAKEDKSNPTEFTVPAKLKELYKNKDFGQYAYKGDVPVCFISNNDITGGNSGSPILNAKGELIGLAFDGNWEAMSGDIAFEHKLQRCINVDVRYVLFIIDKFAGAGHLLNEMTIVK